ncbi:MAG: hypothetical protein JAZ03_05020, partial [Candidatus Thiodiazotropha taylori]|nr:hypothetical protein [Candidatus Thiodiazotropha taylori]MCW4333287.1 hypothetical protein [Candidatus Thiodiazotropha endolucinida]
MIISYNVRDTRCYSLQKMEDHCVLKRLLTQDITGQINGLRELSPFKVGQSVKQGRAGLLLCLNWSH